MEAAVRPAVPVGIVRWRDSPNCWSPCVKVTYELREAGWAVLAAAQEPLSQGTIADGRVVQPNDFVEAKGACEVAIVGAALRDFHSPIRVRVAGLTLAGTAAALGARTLGARREYFSQETARLPFPSHPLEIVIEGMGPTIRSAVPAPAPWLGVVAGGRWDAAEAVRTFADAVLVDPARRLCSIVHRGFFAYPGAIEEVSLVVDALGGLHQGGAAQVRWWPRARVVSLEELERAASTPASPRFGARPGEATASMEAIADEAELGTGTLPPGAKSPVASLGTAPRPVGYDASKPPTQQLPALRPPQPAPPAPDGDEEPVTPRARAPRSVSIRPRMDALVETDAPPADTGPRSERGDALGERTNQLERSSLLGAIGGGLPFESEPEAPTKRPAIATPASDDSSEATNVLDRSALLRAAEARARERAAKEGREDDDADGGIYDEDTNTEDGDGGEEATPHGDDAPLAPDDTPAGAPDGEPAAADGARRWRTSAPAPAVDDDEPTPEPDEPTTLPPPPIDPETTDRPPAPGTMPPPPMRARETMPPPDDEDEAHTHRPPFVPFAARDPSSADAPPARASGTMPPPSDAPPGPPARETMPPTDDPPSRTHAPRETMPPPDAGTSPSKTLPPLAQHALGHGRARETLAAVDLEAVRNDDMPFRRKPGGPEPPAPLPAPPAVPRSISSARSSEESTALFVLPTAARPALPFEESRGEPPLVARAENDEPRGGLPFVGRAAPIPSAPEPPMSAGAIAPPARAVPLEGMRMESMGAPPPTPLAEDRWRPQPVERPPAIQRAALKGPSMTLDEYAAVRAELWAAERPRREILKSHGLSELRWRAAERRFAADMDALSSDPDKVLSILSRLQSRAGDPTPAPQG